MEMNVALEEGSQASGLARFDPEGQCASHLIGENDSLRLFTEGDDLHDAMIAAIEAAQRSIRLEVYIFAADEVGWRFARALRQRHVPEWMQSPSFRIFENDLSRYCHI